MVNLVAYIPVLHAGYLQFFRQQHSQATTLFLIGDEYTSEFASLRKDIRALPAAMMVQMINSLELFEQVRVLDADAVQYLNDTSDLLVMPYEDVSCFVAETCFSQKHIVYDPIFLRWDKKRTLMAQDVLPDQRISAQEFDQEWMQQAVKISHKSSDWWRQVGALIIKDKKVVAQSKNIHLPYDFQQYIDGDPRANFSSGERIELSSSLHAESACIAQAAKKGSSLEAAEMYTSTFPCPVCAKLIAYSGIQKLFYLDGYSLLDGQPILKSMGVEIVKVRM